MRVEVDGVVLPDEPVVPPGLDVGDLERVADGLHVARRDAARRPEQRRQTRLQRFAHWNSRMNEM